MEGKEDWKEIIAGLVFSVFETVGPTPVVCFPEDLDELQQLNVAMKTISLLMGESVYQEGEQLDSIKYFGILPFPDLGLTGLTYFFLIPDETARGQAKASTISFLVKDTHTGFLYENMKDLSLLLADTALSLKANVEVSEAKEIVLELQEKIETYITNVKAPLSSTRRLKIIFSGLDASGKTSFLRALRQRYSELTDIKPTKGIERTESTILGQNIVEWDVGGQLKYRANFMKQADLYLYDTNLLNFLIDIKDELRYGEALDFFGQIIKVFRGFKQFPPIVVNFSKVDPDIKEIGSVIQQISFLKEEFKKIGQGFNIKFFETSIFDPYSLNKSFSEGISAMSPNRDILRGQLEWLARKVDAQAILLINENSVILSDYSKDVRSGKISEITAPYFQNLYRTFAEFKLMKRNNALWRMDDELAVFFLLPLKDYPIFLLCLLENQDSLITKLHHNLAEFRKRIDPLIETYL
jgi:GTPase SAR1 family protein